MHIAGKKGGSAKARAPKVANDTLRSIATAKILIALSEGELAGGITAKDIYFDGTPIENQDGSVNYPDVKWEVRTGTESQSYIPGLDGAENFNTQRVELTTANAWTKTFTDPTWSAVTVRLSVPTFMEQKTNGDIVGATVAYKVERQTDNGAFEVVYNGSFNGKASSQYERQHRIDLPAGGTSWTVRITRITPDAADPVRLQNKTFVEGYASVIDAKLRYPNTALLYVQFDAEQFSNIPQISVKCKGRVIQVPKGYDPETRTYPTSWDGTFEWKYSNNPAWVFYDLVTNERFGVGKRLRDPATNVPLVDKWELYRIAQYCDQLVPDGLGKGGMEPRFLCDVYIQSQNEAFNVIRDIASIFRGMTYWANNNLTVMADIPPTQEAWDDAHGLDYVFTRANVIDGVFTYAGGSRKYRYSVAACSYSDPNNHYSDAVEMVAENRLVTRYGINQTDIAGIGCTRRSEANRRGRYALLTNENDRIVTFDTGLDGYIPLPGKIIGVADQMLSGRVMGGRIVSATTKTIICDRAPDAKQNDRVIVNLPSGQSQARTVASVNGNTITVTVSFTAIPAAQSIWTIDAQDIAIQQYRVTRVVHNENDTFSITGVYHNPNKYDAIDTGARLEAPVISALPTGAIAAPAKVEITSHDYVFQNQRIQVMRVTWPAVKDAIAYEAQWQKDNGDWVSVARAGARSFEVQGIYTGRYLARVRAINAAQAASLWTTSMETQLTGKAGLPSPPDTFTTTSILWGVQLDWTFPSDSADTLHTEIQYADDASGTNAQLLTEVPYPQKTYQRLGLSAVGPNVVNYYRARLIDRIGNYSQWTPWVKGQPDDEASHYIDAFDAGLRDTDTFKELTAGIQDVTAKLTDAQKDLLKATQDLATETTERKSDIAKEVAERTQAITDAANAAELSIVQKAGILGTRIDTVNSSVDTLKNSVAQQIASISAGSGETFDALNIWFFDTDAQGWTTEAGTPVDVTAGWMKPSDKRIISPPLHADATKYKYIKMRIRKTGTSSTAAFSMEWKEGADSAFGHSTPLPTPKFDATGVATVDIPDIPWTQEVHQIAFVSTVAPTATDFYEFDWIALGRPTPGASIAALEEVRQASQDAVSKEVIDRETLATQLRGDYTGTDEGQVTSGLIYSERKASQDRDKAIADDVSQLKTDYNQNKATVTQQLSALSLADQATASQLNTLQSALHEANADTGNVLLNGSFESGDTPWIFTAGQVAIVATDHQEGAKAAQLNPVANAATVLGYPAIPIKKGGVYELSYWYKASSNFAEATANTSMVNIKNGNTVLATAKLAKVGSWTQGTLRVAPTANISVTLEFTSRIGAGTLVIDNVSFKDISIQEAVERLDNMQKVQLDLSALNANTWYPVTVDMSGQTRDLDFEAFRFRLSRPLDASYGKPAWATHNSGFSLTLDWQAIPSGYGANLPDRRIEEFQYQWTLNKESPVLDVGQMTNSSNEYVYVRGGSKYDFWLRKGLTAVIQTAAFTANSQSVAPLTAYDASKVPQSTTQQADATATITNQLKTDVKKNGDDIKAQAITLNQINTTVGNSSASIAEMQKTIAEKALAQTQGFDQQRVQIGQNRSDITDLDTQVANLDSTYNTRMSTLESSVRNANASITTLQQTQAGDKTALTQQITRLTSTTDGKKPLNEAIVEIKATAEAATTSDEVNQKITTALSAQWGVKVVGGTTATPRIAGIQLGATQKGTQFLVDADSFAVYTSKGGGNQLLFGTDANGTYFKDAFFRNASIGFARISGVKITDAHIDNGTISAAKIKNLTVTTAQITSFSSEVGKIANANIGTAKIAWANITGVSIGDAQISSLNVNKLTGDVVTMIPLSNGDKGAPGYWTTGPVKWNRKIVGTQLTAGAFNGGTAGIFLTVGWGTSAAAAKAAVDQIFAGTGPKGNAYSLVLSPNAKPNVWDVDAGSLPPTTIPANNYACVKFSSSYTQGKGFAPVTTSVMMYKG